MIQANELRIGNIVSYKGILGIVDWIQKESIAIAFFERQANLSNGAIINGENLTPISLTPEILEKCGAEKFPTGKKDYSLHGVLLSYAECRNVYTHNGKELPSLHTLQNYIFALTGEELTFKP